MGKISRRVFLLGTGAAIGVAGSKVLTASSPVLDGTNRISSPAKITTRLNDASELNATNIHYHKLISTPPGEQLHTELREQLSIAAADSHPVNIGAARHSMGGQAIPEDGIAITFNNSNVEADESNTSYTVHAGTRWSEVIRQLNPIGYSPKVMQSNNDFGVASSFCVNAHGWAAPHGPMGSTVLSLEMILPDGTSLTCSRQENKDIFCHAMGGYGITGLITSLEVQMEPNIRLIPSYTTMNSEAFAPALKNAIQDSDLNMVYGRLNIDREHFAQEAMLVSFKASDDQLELPELSSPGLISNASRHLLRKQLGNEQMKRFRWGIETRIGPHINPSTITRNAVFQESVDVFRDNNPERVDILHEYFVDLDQFPLFIKACQDVIPASYQELLNITLRYVEADTESWLNYAPQPRIAAVMLFSQEKTQRAEADMKRLTRAMIERVADIDGSYYLPYRLHATLEQFVQAYPRAEEFARYKRELDPQLILRNALWDTYLERL